MEDMGNIIWGILEGLHNIIGGNIRWFIFKNKSRKEYKSQFVLNLIVTLSLLFIVAYIIILIADKVNS